jgi:hypothetical protein
MKRVLPGVFDSMCPAIESYGYTFKILKIKIGMLY